MIVSTTRCRWHRMINVAIGDKDLLDELSCVEGGEQPRSRVQIEMCYAAGVALREVMIKVCYKSNDMMRRGLSSSELGAMRDLVKATNEEARHPALRGVGVAGHVARTFHAWNVGMDLWSPFPIPGGRFAVLKPYWHVDDNYPSSKFTLWDPRGFAPEHRFDVEFYHWRFV